MKSQILYFIFLLSLFFSVFSSCERKNAAVDVAIILPNRSQNTMQFDHLGQQQWVRKNASVLANEVVLIESKQYESKGSFNSVTPSFLSTSDYQVNCYMLVVSGPSEEPQFSRNYCSKKIDPTQNLEADKNSTQLFFGDYAGLIDPFFGKTVYMSIKPGSKRKFTLLGFNSLVACSEVYSAFQNKANLSKAYRIATSEELDLIPGVPVTIDLTLASEVDYTDYYSDCTMSDPTINFPKYEYAFLSKNTFPKKTFRSFSTPQTTNYYCEPIDITLIANDPLTNQDIPGTVLEDEFFRLENGTSVTVTYDTEKNCYEDTSLTDELGYPFFKITTNQTKAQRWFKNRRGGTSNFTFALDTIGTSQTITASFEQFFSTSGVIVDNIHPEKLVMNKCYEGVVALRDLHGFMVSSTVPFEIVNTDFTTTNFATFFGNSFDCENNLNINQPISFDISTSSKSYYFKIVNTVTAFDFNADVSGTSFDASSTQQVRVVNETSVANQNEFASIKVYSKPALPNIATLDFGESDCYPLFVSLLREDLTEYVQDSTSIYNMLPLKVRVADPTGPDTNAYALYADNICTDLIHPINSTGSVSGTEISAPAANSTFYKLYVKPDNSGTNGLRKLEFYYNDTPVGSHLFNLVTLP